MNLKKYLAQIIVLIIVTIACSSVSCVFALGTFYERDSRQQVQIGNLEKSVSELQWAVAELTATNKAICSQLNRIENKMDHLS